MVNKRVWNAVLGCNLKNDREANNFQGKQFNIMVIKPTPQPVMLKTEVERFYWRPTRLLKSNTPKRCPFHYRRLECKSKKSQNSWSNRQIWPWNAEWSRAKTNRVLPIEHTGHSKHPLPATQEKTTHGHHQMVNTEIRYSLQPKM